jgi:peptidoglycan hydrolase-like amidase
MEQVFIEIGLLSAESITFTLEGAFHTSRETELNEGRYVATYRDETSFFLRGNGEEEIIPAHLSLLHSEKFHDGSFRIEEIIAGRQFHWEKAQEHTFQGILKIFPVGGKLTAVNIVELEKYLLSVISSEMSAEAPVEFLKAHAVISRSWFLAQVNRKKKSRDNPYPEGYMKIDNGYLRWYTREDHDHYDVCADDHCQRYYGFGHSISRNVSMAVKDTEGQVLLHNGEICDARFSKCCGGMTEAFENVWEPVRHPYLTRVVDGTDAQLCDLTDEEQAKEWIISTPPAFCNAGDAAVLAQSLTGQDFRTRDFYRWTVKITQADIRSLLLNKGDIRLGNILSLEALERGVSGRIIRLKITGDESSVIVGKELEIRRLLSPSHLYSSAFVAEAEYDRPDCNIPSAFILRGAGWGHGTGLCQIGAAIMGSKGYTYEEILSHYFPYTTISKQY